MAKEGGQRERKSLKKAILFKSQCGGKSSPALISGKYMYVHVRDAWEAPVITVLSDSEMYRRIEHLSSSVFQHSSNDCFLTICCNSLSVLFHFLPTTYNQTRLQKI